MFGKKVANFNVFSFEEIYEGMKKNGKGLEKMPVCFIIRHPDRHVFLSLKALGQATLYDDRECILIETQEAGLACAFIKHHVCDEDCDKINNDVSDFDKMSNKEKIER